ncbi:uncharacterized protein Z520_10881 [Fonsecaea multimorphosa CBS 102226]|uniref:PrpF protein n=1 Tax=Fonsecaea multimorphosa CBS 102226 TaxID=1442371 RepID=A0A0D2I8F6_9EURO|nr:uncharacterized protein Z520_10881 [Fonsecaea multimorphosa CBS 102226]KIX93461.1 hypothetical protein Z520_10881 [Fonsecaea multimorphosa CBS 102226]OAL18758.1 hypothetical protein AYO22_10452 [Fonsecaea multimorphosa]
MSEGQIAIPAVYLRGGSSKAMFFKEEDIPPPGLLRERVLKRVMGTPDPIQIDGMGGTRIVTSKVAIIKASDREDADVEYTFGQVGIAEDHIRLRGNCGNISVGVGPFAIDEGIIKKPFRKGVALDPDLQTREVRIYQTAIKRLLIAHVPVSAKSGKSISRGDFAIAGVPGTGAPILMDFRNTSAGFLNKGPLPTGTPTETIEIEGIKVPITIVDIAQLTSFIQAKDVGVADLASRSATSITNDKELIARCREVRGKVAHKLGMCTNWELVDQQSPGLPSVVMVEPVRDNTVGSLGGAHIVSRFILNNMCHDGMAGTVAAATAACSRLQGTLINTLTNGGAKSLDDPEFRISHPLGLFHVRVEAAVDGRRARTTPSEKPEFNVLAFVRTSRRIFEGKVYIPDDVWDGKATESTETANRSNGTNGLHD